MNSTIAGIKRFREYYGEVTMENLTEFFGCSEDAIYDIKRKMRRDCEYSKDRVEKKR